MTVDLLLGSDIGLWVLGEVQPGEVGRIITEDPDIAQRAQGAGTGKPSRIALSVHYPLVLSDAALRGWDAAYNLHPAYLPWGRGHFPLVWAIANDEPAGATLHRMTTRLDAGPIIDQERVEVMPTDTGGSLFLRIREVERVLFRRWFARLASGEVLPERPMAPGGSYHDKAAFAALLETDLDHPHIDRIRRAVTFPGKPGLRAEA